MTELVRYSPWRAVWATTLPLIAISIPLANYLIDAADFHRRYSGGPSNWILAIGIVWLAYALWPSALIYFSSGVESITIDGDTLKTNTGARYNLSELRGVEIERPALRSAYIVLKFPTTELTIGTAFQPIGERKAADLIARTIADAARTSVK